MSTFISDRHWARWLSQSIWVDLEWQEQGDPLLLLTVNTHFYILIHTVCWVFKTQQIFRKLYWHLDIYCQSYLLGVWNKMMYVNRRISTTFCPLLIRKPHWFLPAKQSISSFTWMCQGAESQTDHILACLLRPSLWWFLLSEWKDNNRSLLPS